MSFSAPGVRASKPEPKYGPSPSGSPSRSMICAVSEMSPTATSTPAVPRTSSSVAAGSVGFCANESVPGSNADLAVTTASVPS